MDRKMKNVLREYLDELPPTQEVVDLYKSKLEKCRRDYDAVLKHLDTYENNALITNIFWVLQ